MRFAYAFLVALLCAGSLLAGCNDGDAPPNFNDASVNQDGGAVDLTPSND